jgi:hypothetical protein
MEIKEWTQDDEFTINTNKELLDLEMIYQFLSKTYWAKGLSKNVLLKSILHTPLCYGIYYGSKQVGFARVITEFHSFCLA